QQLDPLDAVETGSRRVEVLLEVERGGREVRVLKAGTGLQDTDLVPLLAQPQGADGPSEAGSDDQDVEVGAGGHQARPSFFSSRRLVVMIAAYFSSDSPSGGVIGTSRWVPTDWA